MSKIQLEVFCKSERGYLKRRNEDFIFSEQAQSETSQERLFILADGFGGNINSNLAVKLVAEVLSETFYADVATETAEKRLKNAIISAQQQLSLKIKEWNTPGIKIGLTVGFIQEEGISAVNMGGGTALLSVSSESKNKEYLTLLPTQGPLEDNTEAAIIMHHLKGKNPRLCLLSDGFNQWLNTTELETIFKKYTRQALLSRLFKLVNIDEAEDNLSVLLVESKNAASSKKSQKPLLIVVLLLTLALIVYLLMQAGVIPMFYSDNKPPIEMPALVSIIPPDTIQPLSTPVIEEAPETSEETSEPPPPVAPPPPEPPPVVIAPPPVLTTQPPLPVITSPPTPTPTPSPRFDKVKVTFSSKQTGTKVFINGTYRGTTPLLLELSPGIYQVLYSRPYFSEKSQSLVVKGDTASANFSMDLRQESYAINIQSEPSGSKVYINGKYEGLTPIILELKPGTWDLTLSRPGYKEYHDKLVIEDTQDLQAKTLRINLIAEIATNQLLWQKMECF